MIVRRYYTLLEMLAVSGIILILLGLSVAALGVFRTGESPERFIDEFRLAAGLTRQRAIATRQRQEVVFAPAERRFRFPVKPLRLPEEISVKINGESWDREAVALVFLPDGSAGECELEFRRGEEIFTLTLLPLTGKIGRRDEAIP